MKLSNEVLSILKAIQGKGGRGLIVGGSVRDFLQDPSRKPKDIDIEVYNLDVESLISLLETYGKVSVVGKSFGVIKLTTEDQDYDFSLPRRENKEGSGHKGFIVQVDPTMTIKEACARRDFTFNAICYDPLAGELVDCFDGKSHLAEGLLVATSEAFSEDSLRVLRGMQFAGRLGLVAHQQTLDLCSGLIPTYPELSKDRVWEEWYKWATKSIVPSKGLEFLKDSGWVSLYPELAGLVEVPQDPQWHPEGDVWVHTKLVVDAAVNVCNREGISGDNRAVLVLAALCHDLGKPECTQVGDRVKSPGHEKAGEEPTRTFLASIGCPKDLVERVIPLVVNHLAHITCQSPKSVRRLADRLAPATIQELCVVIEADHSGRPPLVPCLPLEARELLRLAEELGADEGPLKPILQGRDLIGLGLKPGKQFGVILQAAFQAQLDGEFSNHQEGLVWLAKVV